MTYLFWFYPIMLEILLGLIGGLIIFNLKLLIAPFKAISKKIWLALLLLFIFFRQFATVRDSR